MPKIPIMVLALSGPVRAGGGSAIWDFAQQKCRETSTAPQAVRWMAVCASDRGAQPQQRQKIALSRPRHPKGRKCSLHSFGGFLVPLLAQGCQQWHLSGSTGQVKPVLAAMALRRAIACAAGFDTVHPTLPACLVFGHFAFCLPFPWPWPWAWAAQAAYEVRHAFCAAKRMPGMAAKGMARRLQAGRPAEAGAIECRCSSLVQCTRFRLHLDLNPPCTTSGKTLSKKELPALILRAPEAVLTVT